MKESTLVEMQKKVDSLIRVSQKLILEIQQIDSLSRGTITALQLFMGEKEWSKIVDKMKKAEEKRNKKEQEKKLDLNVE
jgi:ATP sulfurylase|tara:strand:+ start:1153 stop:1389 length:237 start_codon:yes stop_codon:yes gene_type:complete